MQIPVYIFSWTEDGLVIWVSWIDDCLVVGSDNAVAKAKRAMMERFECEDVGDIVEYVGYKIDCMVTLRMEKSFT